jgi:hypothetical protein
MTLFGILGLAYFAGKEIKRKDLLLTAPLLVVIGTALFYIYNPSIHPDQIWAARRLLPVVFPGFIVFGLAFLAEIYSKGSLVMLKRKVSTKTLVTVLATLSVVGPVLATRELAFVREATWYTAVQATCEATDNQDAILWIGSARTQMIEPTKAICGIPSEGYGKLFSNNDKPPKAMLAQAARAAMSRGYKPILGVFGNEKELVDGFNVELTNIHNFSYKQIERSFSPPTQSSDYSNSVMLGELKEDGSVKPYFAK